MNADEKGEILEAPASMELVPWNLAALDEDQLREMFPTPVQAMGALIAARAVIARAPKALDDYRTKLRTSERNLKIAIGLAVHELRESYPRATMTELRDLAHALDDRVLEAVEARDTAWLEMEYAKDFADAIHDDVEVLRSINKNIRGEH